MINRPTVALGVVLTLAVAAPGIGQKEDWVKSGPPEAPTPRASENTAIDVATDLPTLVVGALDGDDSTYNRQAGDCGGLSGVGTNVAYDTITVTNSSGILAAVDASTSDVGDASACTTGDSYMSVYSPTFNAVNPTANCVTSNDDGGPGVCSAVSFDLAVGQTAIMVVTSFGNGALFDYQVNLDTPACSNGIVYDDGSYEGGLRGPMGTQTFEIAQRFDLPLIGAAGAEVKRICVCLGHSVSAIDDFPVDLVVRRPNSAGTLPGSRLHTESIMAMDVPLFPTCRFYTVDLAGVTFDSEAVFVGVEWNQAASPELLVSEDTDGPGTQPSFYTTNQGGSWSSATGLDPAFRNLGVRVTFDEPFVALSDSSGLLLPGFSLDVDDPFAAQTFLNVRNATDGTLEVDVDYYGEEIEALPRRVDGFTLAAARVLVHDVGSDTTDLDPDGDDVASGLALVSRSDTHDATDLEGDFLNVDFANDFASGDRLFRIPEDLCDLVEIRFLDFGGGSRLTVVVDRPRGDTSPSFTYTVTNQAGAQLNSGSYFTNTHLNVIDAEELAGPGNRFGTVVLDLSKAGGGVVVGKYSAFGRFSMELNGACRD